MQVFDQDEMVEVMPGYGKLREHEACEAKWWYSGHARLASLEANLQQGVLRGDEQCVHDLVAAVVAQGKERISYLREVARARSGRSRHSVKLLRELQDDDIEEHGSHVVLGRLGAALTETKKSRRAARLKARANSEFRAGAKGGKRGEAQDSE